MGGGGWGGFGGNGDRLWVLESRRQSQAVSVMVSCWFVLFIFSCLILFCDSFTM